MYTLEENSGMYKIWKSGVLQLDAATKSKLLRYELDIRELLYPILLKNRV